jgi:hypothetical protein
MAGTYLPLAALLLATAVAILAATSAVPVVAAAAAADKYSGRMVIIHAPGSSRVVSAGGALINKWQQQRRLVEDEVAPEFGSLLGAGNGGVHVTTAALNPDSPFCQPHAQCAALGHGSSTRSCTYWEHCPHTPTAAGHARAVHG